MVVDYLTTVAATLAGLPFRLISRRPVEPPKRALILKPCCLSQVMLTTPLLAALSEAFPETQFDWAVSEWARPAVEDNPRLTQVIDSGRVNLAGGTWDDTQSLIEELRGQEYDTCFIPSRSGRLSYIAWRAGIRQRIGLNAAGRGFAHTHPVKLPKEEQHETDLYLSLASPFGLKCAAGLEFYPADDDRTSIAERLEGQFGWQGIMPLVILHPGGGDNPVRVEKGKRWPAERFALLGSRLINKYGARVLVVGVEQERPLAEAVIGLMPGSVPNLAGQMSLSELGALCEMADLYVGNDAGPTHVAAAVGCPTLTFFGPSDPAVSGPRAPGGRTAVLRAERLTEPFTWEQSVTADEGFAAAERLLEGSEQEQIGAVA